jgi:hypothetical protein
MANDRAQAGLAGKTANYPGLKCREFRGKTLKTKRHPDSTSKLQGAALIPAFKTH